MLGLNILIGTPGRLLDHVETTKTLGLGRVRWLVLDEADRLLEKGFEETLAKLLGVLKKSRGSTIGRNTGRTNVLLSATLDERLERLANLSLNNPVKINVTSNDVPALLNGGDDGDGPQQFSTSERLTQYYVTLPCKLRLVVLFAFLKWKCEPFQNG